MTKKLNGKNKAMSTSDAGVVTKAPKKGVLRVYVFKDGHRVEASSYSEALAIYKKSIKKK